MGLAILFAATVDAVSGICISSKHCVLSWVGWNGSLATALSFFPLLRALVIVYTYTSSGIVGVLLLRVCK